MQNIEPQNNERRRELKSVSDNGELTFVIRHSLFDIRYSLCLFEATAVAKERG